VNSGDIALILLAAGRGERFGGGKLAANLAGKPLAQHAADCLRAIPLAGYFAIVGPDTPPLPGYQTSLLDPPGSPQSRSLALGIAAARTCGARAVLIALADMPLVPRSHFDAMLTLFDGDRLASLGPDSVMPPALFGARHFGALAALTGDRGAGSLLRDAPTVTLPEGTALDVDRPEDLIHAQHWLQTRTPPA